MRFKPLTVVALLAAAGLATASYAGPTISTQTMPGCEFQFLHDLFLGPRLDSTGHESNLFPTHGERL